MAIENDKNDPSAAKTEIAMPAIAPAKKVSKRRRVKLAPPPKALAVDVGTWGENNFYAGFDRSIDSGGIFIASLETLPVGHELDLEILIEGKKVASRAKVEWMRLDNLANPECTQGAGLKLLSLSPEAKKVIESFFAKRAPSFYKAV
jgi:Tfp pilus assembly protein PilZ